MAEEKVHGAVELGVNPNQQNHPDVPHQGAEINGEEEHKDDVLQL